jgi:hypothetical protein
MTVANNKSARVHNEVKLRLIRSTNAEGARAAGRGAL